MTLGGKEHTPLGRNRPTTGAGGRPAQTIALEPSSRTVKIGPEKIAFPKKEFEILSLLTAHPGKTFTRKAILGAVWGNGVVVEARTVDVHIRKIREKLNAGSSLIETVKGEGYRWREF
jgi:two-component system, OmpR family, alkaline phosphatase synthesis response regulator PhoP